MLGRLRITVTAVLEYDVDPSHYGLSDDATLEDVAREERELFAEDGYATDTLLTHENTQWNVEVETIEG
jgi:hypothetical protein